MARPLDARARAARFDRVVRGSPYARIDEFATFLGHDSLVTRARCADAAIQRPRKRAATNAAEHVPDRLGETHDLNVCGVLVAARAPTPERVGGSPDQEKTRENPPEKPSF